MDRLEEAAEEERDLTTEDLDLWGRIVDAIAGLVADLEQSGGDRFRQLDDGVGMQLTMYPSEISLTTPYWFEGNEAERVVEKLRQVSAAVEGATGLVAYDPQAGAPFLSEGAAAAAASTFDQVAGSMASHVSVESPAPTAHPRWAFWRT